MECKTVAGFGLGLVAGAIIGGAFALLYAPKSGKETRRMIKDKAEDIVDMIKEGASGAIDTASDAVSEAGKKGHATAHAIRR